MRVVVLELNRYCRLVLPQLGNRLNLTEMVAR